MIPLRMTTPSLSDLADLYDPDGRDSFLTVYVDRTDRGSIDHLRSRFEACSKLLPKATVKAFGKHFALIEKDLNENDPPPRIRGLVWMFGLEEGEILRRDLSEKVATALIVDSSPYLLPLATLEEDWEPAVLALVDHEHLILVTVTLAGLERVAKDSVDLLGHHRRGGSSAARFQRRRQEAVKEFLEGAAQATGDLVDSIGARHLVVAGPGTGKVEFLGYLSAPVRALLRGTLDIDLSTPDGQLQEEVRALVQAAEHAEEREDLLELRRAILTDGLATYGVSAVRDAVVAARVDTILIEKGLSQAGWICVPCRMVGPGVARPCPSCDRATDDVDLIEELVQIAISYDARLQSIAPPSFLSDLGGVAALLRF